MARIWIGLLLAVMMTTAAPAHAGSDEFQQWIISSANVKLGGKWRLQNDLFIRFSDQRHGLYEIEDGLLLGYQLSKKVGIYAGYVHNPLYLGGDFVVMERRARQFVTLDNLATIGKATFSARLRTEQRWRDHQPGTGWRVRPVARLVVPLGDKKGPSLVLTSEPFFNLNRTVFQPVRGFERARNAIALSQPLGKSVRIEAGYLNQYRVIRNGPDGMDHVLTAAANFAF